MAIAESSIRADILKEVLAVIKNNIVTSGVKVTSAWTNDSANLPEVVVEATNVPRVQESFGTTSQAYSRRGDIDIEIFATSMKGLLTLTDDVEQAIFNNLGSLTLQKVELGTSSPAHFDLNGKMVHNITIPISFILRL